MQTLDYRTFCQRCQEPTYHEIRYRSDNTFVGKVLVCQDCGEKILQLLGSGT